MENLFSPPVAETTGDDAEATTRELTEYIRDFSRVQILNTEIQTITARINARHDLFESKPWYATSVSSHAAYRCMERIQEFTLEEPAIMSDVINTENPELSLSLIGNVKTFILTAMAHSVKAGNFQEKASKNNKGEKEYHHRCLIDKWAFRNRTVELWGVVEGNTVKTIYLNWFVKTKEQR